MLSWMTSSDHPSETTEMIGSQPTEEGIWGFKLVTFSGSWSQMCALRGPFGYILYGSREVFNWPTDLLGLVLPHETIHLDPFGCFWLIFRAIAMSQCGFYSEKTREKSPTTGSSSSEDDAPPARWAHEFAEPPETPPRSTGSTGTTTQCALESLELLGKPQNLSIKTDETILSYINGSSSTGYEEIIG